MNESSKDVQSKRELMKMAIEVIPHMTEKEMIDLAVVFLNVTARMYKE